MLEKEYKFADPTSEVIFHAYPQSPVAEKVRVVFASKDLNGAAWKFRVHALEVLHKNSSVRAGFEGRQADTRRFCCTELDDEGPNIRIIRDETVLLCIGGGGDGSCDGVARARR